MGAGGITNKGIIIVHGRRGDLPTKEVKPNSIYDLYVDGVKVQRRYFDENGRAVRNRDYIHQDAHNNHTFPHDHLWDWNKQPPRNPDYVEPDYENFI